MNVTVEQFRKEAARRRAGRSRGAAPYSSEQKAFAVDWTRAVIAKGGSYTSAARDLGVSEMTLRTWASAGPAEKSQATALRRVVVRPPATDLVAGPSVVVVTASGHRVLGLDVASAATLLRALG